MNFGDAARYCRDLTEGGFTDWRLATVKQIWNLYTKSVVANPNSSFNFWTTDQYGTGYYLIRFSDGFSGYTQGVNSNYARCIR